MLKKLVLPSAFRIVVLGGVVFLAITTEKTFFSKIILLHPISPESRCTPFVLGTKGVHFLYIISQLTNSIWQPQSRQPTLTNFVALTLHLQTEH